MDIRDPGLFSRGRITLPLSQHITPDSLLQELTQAWGPRGFEVYKTALVGADLVLKKSGWTGIAIKIKHGAQTEIFFNAFAPSLLVRLLAMGLIPILIVNSTSWKPLLAEFKQRVPGVPTKSGLMVGLGETDDEILEVMRDLRAHDVDMLTIGQYLAPTNHHLPVRRYAHPDVFRMFEAEAAKMGFTHAACGPLVRSSYHADQQAHAAGLV